MTIQPINLGATANDGTGDGLRTGGDKINQNFQELDLRVTNAQAKAGEVDAVKTRMNQAERNIINQQQTSIDHGNSITSLESRTTSLEGQITDGRVPNGGTTGQVLSKASNLDQDTHWIDPPEGGGGGSGGTSLPAFPSTSTMTLTKSLFGRFKTFGGGATAVTTNLVMELESPFMALEIGIPNIHANAQNGVKVSVGLLEAKAPQAWLVDINPTGGVWHDLTFGGQPTANLPARKGVDLPSWTWSDRFTFSSLPRTDGVRRPFILVRIEFPVGVFGSAPYLGIANWRQATSIRALSAGTQNVAGVTTKEDYTQTLNVEDNICIPAVRYYTERAGRQFLIGGDALSEGTHGFPYGMGAAQLVAYRNSTPDSPIEYFNAAIHASTPLVYSQNLRNVLDMVKPTHVIYSPYSVNEASLTTGLSEQSVRNLRNALALTLDSIRNMKMPIKTLLVEGLPVNSSGKNLGEGDATRRAVNTWLSQFTGPSVAVGYAALVTGARVNGQDQIAEGMAAPDNFHLNPSGYSALANMQAFYLLN